LHKLYSDEAVQAWAAQGCRTAGIGCIDCKQPLIDAVLAEQSQMHERAAHYSSDPTLIRNMIADGCERAREVAEETLEEVRRCMGLTYD
jgi:tryptophanyl-tRNA synthetase